MRATWLGPWPPGPEQDRLMTHLDPVVAVAFTPDGKKVATATGSSFISLWDVTTHEVLQMLRDPAGAVRALAISPDGLTLVTGGDGKVVKLWDLATGRERASLQGPRRPDHLPRVLERWQAPRLGEPRCLRDHLGRRQERPSARPWRGTQARSPAWRSRPMARRSPPARSTGL